MAYFLLLSNQRSSAYRDIPGSATSNVVGGRADIIKSGITMSLAMLKEAGSLASKIPCISVIAGMLLYYIQVHDVRRVLSLFRETFLIVRAIRIFNSAKGSGW
jgi:hypothetical protein